MSQDKTLDEWIKIFGDVYSPDPNMLNPANKAIQDKLDNDQGFLLDVCTRILMIEDSEDDIIKKAKTLSAVILSQILNIRNNLKDIRSNLIQNEELTDQIKKALKRNVFSADASIRNVSAQCYSYLFAILTKNWQDGIDDIVNSFGNAILLPYGYIGLISIMREIINLIPIVEGIVPDFKNQFAHTTVFCIDILSRDKSDENYIPELRIEACRFIHDIIYMYKEIFDDDDTKAGRIPLLLKNLGNSFQINNIDLYLILHRLLFMIIMQYYPQSPTFIGKITSYVYNCFEIYSSNPDFLNISIYFWKELATLEENIVTKYDIDEKLCRPSTVERLDTLLSEAESEKLIPILLDFMENIDENDTEVEDAEKNPKPSMYSVVSVASLYQLLPELVFNKVSQRIEDNIPKAKTWSNIHSIVLMIYSITDEPLNEIVGEFISKKFDLLIKASMPDQVPRLRETALFMIGFAIKNYPQIIARNDSDKHINDIINIIEPSLNIDAPKQSNISNSMLQIFTRYTSIIYNLCAVWEDRLFESKLPSYFDKFYEILGVMFNYGIYNNDQILIQNSAESMNQLIFNATPDLITKLGELYTNVLGFLDQSRTQNFVPEIRFMVQSSFCSNISTLLLKLKKNLSPNGREIIATYASRTLELLYVLLSNKNNLIYEEGLMAVSALVNATNCSEEDFYIEIFNQESITKLISDFIYNGLISKNSGVINATCLLIGNLYFFLNEKIPQLVDAIPDIFNALKDIILENKEERDVHPFVLKAIADIFGSLDKVEGPIPDLEYELKDLLTKIYDISGKLDISNKDDVEYGNLFYQYLSDAFCGYAKVYYSYENQQKEREQLFLLDKLANYIYRLSPRIDENVYVSFAKTARQFATRCSRRNNVILNRHSIHRILKQGLEDSTTQESKKKIKEALDFLKSK